MSEFSFLISFTSNDSKRIYPENSGCDFYFRLEKRLKTDQGRWNVTLFNFHNSEINPQNDTAIICMDGVTQSVVGDNMWLPCLNRYPKGYLSLSTKFPGVTMISPNVAGEDRARSLIAEDQARELQERHRKSLLPPEGVVSDPDQNPHLAAASETYRQANSNPGHSIQRVKHKRELSVVDLREKLLQSPTWNK